jgi:hypothetical protein
VYSENDYILAFLYRATSIQFGVAGLQQIADVEGVENLDLSKEVSGHLRYPELIGKILKRSGFEGIKVEDTDIEEEKVAEINLIDFEEESWKVDGDVKALNQTAIAELTGESVERGGGSRAEAEIEVTRAMAVVTVRDNGSDSDDGGILMVDNDSDGELTEIPGEPIVDSEEGREMERRESGKIMIMEEPKTLGSFPKTKRTTAADMGLY